MKRVLIISPYFPPVNAADMQRIRMSLPYFKNYGWEAEVVMVDPKYGEMPHDSLLSKSIADTDLTIHQVKAFSKSITSKIGLGSIALRSLWYYYQYVNKLLQHSKFDLIYFSTTQFPVCILGVFWKQKFKIPYVIDMQDPWHTEYYLNKPKTERPPKFWFSYYLNKFMEPLAMKKVDGLISVSINYIEELRSRYPQIQDKPFSVIPFGAHQLDYDIAADLSNSETFKLSQQNLNIIYTGAVGSIMKESISFLMQALSNLKQQESCFNQLKIYFIGTSYAPKGKGIASVIPLAKQYNVQQIIEEQTDRIGYFESLQLAKKSDILLVIGSDDQAYLPSKIFNYVLANKPIIGLFPKANKAAEFLKEHANGIIIDQFSANQLDNLKSFLEQNIKDSLHLKSLNKLKVYENFADNFTKMQCDLFKHIIFHFSQKIKK